MKFNPGDPVWVRGGSGAVPLGEYASVIEPVNTYYRGTCSVCRITDNRYIVTVLSVLYSVCACHLRPRRDDYQQREATVPMASIRSFLKEISERSKETQSS